MKRNLVIVVTLTFVLTFGMVGSGLMAADSINAYIGFARE